MEELLKKVLLIGVGAAMLTREKLENFLDELSKTPEKIKEGDILSQIIKKGQEAREELERKIGKRLEKIIDRANFATKEDIARVERKIGKLEEKIEKIKG